MQCPSCHAETAVDAAFCRGCGTALPRSDAAAPQASGISWKWVAIGVAVMFGTNMGVGFVLGAVLGPERIQALGVYGWAAIGLLCYGIGGFIVGKRSPGKTILEPGLSSAIAVALWVVFSGSFNLGAIVIGGILPFGAGLLGGYIGEKSQGTI